MGSNSFRICFFAGVEDKSLLSLMQWYANDIRILKELGFEVIVATKWREIPWNCDLYYAWWPTKGVLPLIKGKISRKPVIMVAGGSEVVHSYSLKYNFNNSTLIKKIAVVLSLRYADKVLSISKSAEKEILGLVPMANVETVYLSVDTEIFKPSSDINKEIILTISHLNKENVSRKAILSIVYAAKKIVEKFPTQKFVIAGRKLDAFSEVEKEVQLLGLYNNFIFPGKISNEEKLDYFRRSLVYLQPTYHEGFGLAIAEAMSCGVPVVTSNIGSVREVVADCGLYAKADDIDGIANAVIKLLEDKKLRDSIGTCARLRIVNNFSYEKRKEKIKRIIESFLNSEERNEATCSKL